MPLLFCFLRLALTATELFKYMREQWHDPTIDKIKKLFKHRFFRDTKNLKRSPSCIHDCVHSSPEYQINTLVLSKRLNCPPHSIRHVTQQSRPLSIGNSIGRCRLKPSMSIVWVLRLVNCSSTEMVLSTKAFSKHVPINCESFRMVQRSCENCCIARNILHNAIWSECKTPRRIDGSMYSELCCTPTYSVRISSSFQISVLAGDLIAEPCREISHVTYGGNLIICLLVRCGDQIAL